MKHLKKAKSRLRAGLGAEATERVAAALLEDAFTLCSSVTFLTWWVVSDDTEVLERAQGRGFETLADEGAGLNEAVALATVTAKAGGATSVTVVPADVPLAWRGDVEDLLDTGATSEVVVVPSGADGGTNALYMSPPGLIDPHFGGSSLQAHLRAAEKGSFRCTVLALPRLALDIDTIEDVDELLRRQGEEPRSASGRLLLELRGAPSS